MKAMSHNGKSYAASFFVSACRVGNHVALAVLMAVAAFLDATGDIVGRWRFDGLTVGETLSAGAVIENAVNPGIFDAVVKPVDASQADEQYLPTVAVGFTGHDHLLPDNSGTWYAGGKRPETVACGLLFKGGGKKGYYLEIADPEGTLKTSAWTLEVFCKKSDAANLSGTVFSMPATTDATMPGTNVFAIVSPLNTWNDQYYLTGTTGAYVYQRKNWNSGGSYQDGNWHHIAVTFSNGKFTGYRRQSAMWPASGTGTLTTYPDNSSPIIIGGDFFGTSMLNGVITEVRLSNAALATSNMMAAKPLADAFPDGTTLFYAGFDGGFDDVGSCSSLCAPGVAAKFDESDTAEVPTFTGGIPGEWIVEREGNRLIRRSTAALHVATGKVTWADAKMLLYQPTFTVEFFYRHAGTPRQFSSICGLQKGWLTSHGGKFSPWAFSFNVYWQMSFRMTGKNSLMAKPCGSGTATTTSDDGKWHHVAITVDAGDGRTNTTVKTYLDGTPTGTSTVSGIVEYNSSAVPVHVGVADYPFTGEIDELRIVKGVLPVGKMMKAKRSLGLSIVFR